MQTQATARGLRIAPRKLGLVASLVRGRTVEDALVILQHTPKKAAPMLARVIESARANARHNNRANVDELVIDELQVGSGPRMKRYFTAARGSARRYMKRTSHVRVVVSAPDKPNTASKSAAPKPVAEKVAQSAKAEGAA